MGLQRDSCALMTFSNDTKDKQVSYDEATQLATAIINMSFNEEPILNNSFDPSNALDMDAEHSEHSTHRTLKSRLLDATGEDMEVLKSTLALRIDQGRGETLFELGLEDDGSTMDLSDEEYRQCLQTLGSVAAELGADYADIEELTEGSRESGRVARKDGNRVSYIMIRKRPVSVEDLLEIRLAVVGNVDAGKSTMLGVLTKGVLDDGRGLARVNLFRHKHEIESGRTSSVGGEILGFDSKSRPILHPSGTSRKLTWEDICQRAAKVLSFVDLAGHEKYFKTTVSGMTGNAPEFTILMVAANNGMIGMAKEHLRLALSLAIPVLVIVTKIDRCPANILEQTLKELTTTLKSKSCQKIPMFVEDNDDVVMTAHNFVSERLCPIFQISNVTGHGLDLVRNFLNMLPSLSKYDNNEEFHYEINETYSVPFVGTVVSGILKSGLIHVGDKVVIGPDHVGKYEVVTIKGIQRKRVSVPAARAGQSVTFALKGIRRNMIRNGMVLLPYSKDRPMPKAWKRFEADIYVNYHSTTIQKKYQTMIHCGAVKQSANITEMTQPVLRSGDRALVQFEFIKNPEYLTIDSRIIFREGRTKGIGKIVRLLD